MTAPVTVSERDLRTLPGGVGDSRDDPPAAGRLPSSLLTELAELIRCDNVSFFGASPGVQEFSFMQEVPPAEVSDEFDEHAVITHYWDCQQRSYPERAGDLRSVTKPSGFYSVRQWHSIGMYCDYFRPGGVEHLITPCLPEGQGPAARPGSLARMIFFRGDGRDFSERDRGPPALLRPHLHQAYADTERRPCGVPSTPHGTLTEPPIWRTLVHLGMKVRACRTGCYARLVDVLGRQDRRRSVLHDERALRGIAYCLY